MPTLLEGKKAYELCMALLKSESESEIVDHLDRYGYWNDFDSWQDFGGNENNFSIIGNQQSRPTAAMIEKLINSIDAVLMRECLKDGINPEGSNAPQSMTDALITYFNIRDGNLANVGAKERTKLAEEIGFIATGTRSLPNYIIFDKGEGQTPKKMPDTFLSLAKSNKIRIPFVQGKFNMGGTGVLLFCGTLNLQLIISRRHPDIARYRESGDPTAFEWGFTIVRRENPPAGFRSSIFTYLAPSQVIPHFKVDRIEIPVGMTGTQRLPTLEWGTIIKLYEYEMTGARSNILREFYEQSSLLLPRVGLPIRFYERRDFEGHSLEATLVGLLVRLDEDRNENLEDGFPATGKIAAGGQSLPLKIFAFKKGRAQHYRKGEGILFTLNGQTHGILPSDFFRRRNVGMSYLADSLLIVVECDQVQRPNEILFMNSRDRLRSGELRSDIESQLEELLKNHPGLRSLRERRRREEVENQLADSRPLKDVLQEILKKSPSLSALFIDGVDLANPFKSKFVGETENFIGKEFPTYFRLKRGEESKNCHAKARFRVQFETDARNDYFSRDEYPGEFHLYLGDNEIEDYVLNMWNGVVTLTVTLPSEVYAGDDLVYQAIIADDTQVEPFQCEFYRHVVEPLKNTNGHKGHRLPPAGNGRGQRQTTNQLELPHVNEVRQENWLDHNFDRYGALRVVATGEGGFDFYVNMDNVYLKAEEKRSSADVNMRLLEARFKYSLVLIGLALLKEESHEETGEDGDAGSIEKRIAIVTRSIAPVLLPMIATLGDLSLDEVEAEKEPQDE